MIRRNISLAVLLVAVVVSASIAQQKNEEPARDVANPAQKEHQEEKAHHFAVEELDGFHDILHPLVHGALPEGDYDAIRSQLDALLESAKLIMDAELPEKQKDMQEKFQGMAETLVYQIEEMKSVKEDKELARMFEEAHDTFEQIVRMVK